MRFFIVAGVCAVTGVTGAVLGATVGAITNPYHDDLGFGEGLSLLFGGAVGAIIGVFIGALIATELVA